MIKFNLIASIFLVVLLFCGCGRSNIEFSESQKLLIEENGFIEGYFLIYNIGDNFFNPFVIIQLKSYNNRFYHLILRNENELQVNKSNIEKLEKGQIYKLTIKEYDEKPVIETSLRVDEYYMNPVLIWSDGKIVPRVFNCENIYVYNDSMYYKK